MAPLHHGKKETARRLEGVMDGQYRKEPVFSLISKAIRPAQGWQGDFHGEHDPLEIPVVPEV